MASLISWLAHAGARDSAGNAVASGTAWFYQPGTTTTQVPIYSDALETTAISQPVTLDAGGRAKVYTNVPARIEVLQAAGTSVLTMVVDDKSNTVRAEQVEIENAGFSGVSSTGTETAGGETSLQAVLSLAQTSMGGTDWKYTESASATARTMRAAIGRWVTPQDFGALGDDSNDDTTAFQAAITRAMAANKGVWIEPGIYRINATLSCNGATAAGLIIAGASRADCIIKNMQSGAAALSIDLGSAIESSMLLRNFQVTANSTSTGAAIVVVNGDGITIEHATTALHRIGIDTSAVAHSYVEDCLVNSTDSNAASKGFRLGTHATLVKSRVTAATNGRGVSFEGTFGRSNYCRVAGASIGYDLTAADCITDFSVAASCTTGWAVGSVARSGATNCLGSGNTTDITVGATASSVVDVNNAFATRTDSDTSGLLFTFNKSFGLRRFRQSGTGTFSVTPNLGKGPLQVIVLTSGGGAFTISATSTATRYDGETFIMIINAGGAAPTSVVIAAQYTGDLSALTPGVMGSGSIHALLCIWRADTAVWVTTEIRTAIGGFTGNVW